MEIKIFLLLSLNLTCIMLEYRAVNVNKIMFYVEIF